MRLKVPMVCFFVTALSLLPFFAGGCATETAPEPSGPVEKAPVTFVDGTDQEVQILCPVDKVVSITSGVSEILYVLGSADKIVARDSYAVFPPSLEGIPVVAETSHSPNLEAIVEMAPDVVIADTMLKDDLRARLEEAGIPVLVYTTSYPEQTELVVTQMGWKVRLSPASTTSGKSPSTALAPRRLSTSASVWRGESI